MPQAYKVCLAMKSMGNFIAKLTVSKANDVEFGVHLDMDKDSHIGMKR